MKRYHQVSERQQEELKLLHVPSDIMRDRDVREVARMIKEEYDQARAILMQDPDDFLEYWGEARQKKEQGLMRVTICLKVQEDLGGNWIGTKKSRLPPGEIHVLRIAQGRGNPDYKLEGPDAATLAHKAGELIEQDWRRYLVQRRNSRYPKALLDDLASASGISPSTARRRLQEADFMLPPKCRYPLR